MERPKILPHEEHKRLTERGSGSLQPDCSAADLRTALDESVKLQAHYAKLLNQWDGGHRLIFPSTGSWIARLRAYGALPTNAERSDRREKI